MITALSIENFALIEKLNVDFSNGFSVITGETGAGKSILLGALGLVLGKRADLTSLKNTTEKCIVEATFSIAKYNLKAFFEANELDYDDETIIRREILPTGKSRAFINDSPVNLQQLQELSIYLIDVHSQHQTLELSEEDFQFKIIDAIANNQSHLTAYQQLLKQYKEQKVTLNATKASVSLILKEKDYNEFLFNELASANLKNGELQSLELAFEALNNVETIKENLDALLSIANEDNFGLLKSLKEFKAVLQKNTSFSPTYQSLLERTTSILIEFDDITKELNRESELLYSDPEKLEAVNHKLQLIYSLQKKHQVQTVEELIAIQNELENKVISVTTMEENINSLEKSIADLEVQLDSIAVQINHNRSEAIPKLNNQLIAILNQLGMPNVRFNIEITTSDRYQTNGKDTLQFLFAANKGTEFGLLKKVASGGELSRIMLAVKAILAQYSKLPTIIFDEIDTGVSGEIANKMGEIMREMSKTMQVFAITHLPQIAAKGSQHFKVFKTVAEERTVSELKLLSNDQRISEIAEMLSGKEISDSAMNHAKALLN